MSKAKRTHKKIKKFVETALESGTVNLNGRTIEVLDESLLSKRQQKKNEEETLKIELNLNEKLVKIPYYYTLANLPVYVENKYMQKYHFNFTNQQLKEMYTTTKIIVDKWHSTFITDEGVVHRTSFFAVAPHANTQNGIPSLYRFSITRKENDEKHYTINMHAIVAGKPDGWLFLGRFDNNTEAIIHPVLKNYMTKRFLKQHNAVITKNFTPYQLKLKNKLKHKPKYYTSFNYCIPFPHIHQPSAHYGVGEYAERNCPKFLRKCASNTFGENIGYMMKIFNISDHPHFRDENEYILKIIQQEKNTININFPPNPQIVLKEIREMESLEYNEDDVIPVKTEQHQEKQAYCLQRHKTTRRFR